MNMQWPYVWAVYDGLFGFFMTTILLKTLVSILEHIHAHVAGLYKSERLKSKCRLMTENAYIFRRSIVFRDTKYVIRVEKPDVPEEEEHAAHGGHGHGGGGLSEKQQEELVEKIAQGFKGALQHETGKIGATLKSLKNRLNMIDAKVEKL